MKQECIPVGCVPPAAVAIPGGGGLYTPLGADPPREQTPPGSRHLQGWAWRPPLARSPSTYPLDVGLETPLARSPKLPPGCGSGNLQGMLGYHPPKTSCKACWDTTCNACWDTTPSPFMNRITDDCENITLPQLRCGR